MINVPNVLTSLRLLLSIAVFVLLPLGQYLVALIVFIVAASTDWVDGYWARKYGQVTQLGRIFDPFVDKIIICGTFIFLAGDFHRGSGIHAWMAVVIVGRELLVTALRSFLEQQGADFSASMSGKLKMVFQCLAAGASMLALHYGGSARLAEQGLGWLFWTLIISVWVAVLSTVQSGLGYLFIAARLLRQR